MSREYSVLARCLEMPSKLAEQLATVPASNPGLAVNRAFTRIRAQQWKGRRIKQVHFTVTLTRENGDGA